METRPERGEDAASVTEERSRQREHKPISLDDPGVVRSIVEILTEGVYVTAPDGRLLDANPAVLAIFGAETLEQLRERSTEKLWVEPSLRREFYERVAQEGSAFGEELVARRLDGSEITVLDTCQARVDSDGTPIAYYGVLLDISERKNLEHRLTELSVRDPLTGCHNRRFLESVRHTMQRPSQFWGCLVMDLDGFSEVNERFGREEGDRVLQRFAHFVIRHKRADDVLVRLENDEFALFVEVRSPDNLELIAERLMASAPRQAPLAFSIGQAYRKAGESVDEVLARADAAMYEARGRAGEPDRRLAKHEEDEAPTD